MEPTRGDVHVNQPLTNISIAYMQAQGNFIADKVFPNIPVQKQSDRYFTYDRGDWNRDEMQERAPGTESAGSGYNLDNTPTYFCPVYAYHKDVSDMVRANQDTVVNQDAEATNFVTMKGLIKRERMWATKYFNPSVWGNEVTGVAASPTSTQFVKWNDAASKPIESIREYSTHMLQQTGFQPNVLTLGKQAYDALVDHPDIVDRVKYGQTPGRPAMVNMEALAALFEVDRILVCKAIVNTANKNAAGTENSQFIQGAHALLAYAAPAPGLYTPSAGYTFSWNGWFGASGQGNRIKRFRMENLESDRVENQIAFDQKVVAADLGFFMADAV